eukprot:CAMPEP_0178939680 /NCGR_PEP_ID=MMETSP0789-20121207/357_1 /TAXON_ID=3005 /ORGANISM="Rhizosolenia setigera, Strain CCMP 1694" /LENGTH=384 /DNA_ID=CAMNT_0020618573 /DNA_START=1372 /DNA_END=2526 /DNA_ORIENTATION=-
MASSLNTSVVPLSDFTELKEAHKKVIAQNEEITKENRSLKERLEACEKQVELLKQKDKKNSSSKNFQKHEDLINKSNRKKRKVLSETTTTTSVSIGFNDLNVDVLHKIEEFVGQSSYSVFGLINKQCNETYDLYKLPKKTFKYAFADIELIKERMNITPVEDRSLAEAIVYYGREDILQCILTGSDSTESYDTIRHICITAIKGGKLDILRKIFKRSSEGTLRSLTTSNELCGIAVNSYKDFRILQFLRAHGCEWNMKIVMELIVKRRKVLLDDFSAREREHLLSLVDIIHFIQIELVDNQIGLSMCDLCKLLSGIPNHEKEQSNACCVAALCGNLEVLKFLCTNGFKCYESTYLNAKMKNHVHIIEYLHEIGCPIPQNFVDEM